jgi:hypothetical protein
MPVGYLIEEERYEKNFTHHGRFVCTLSCFLQEGTVG